MRPVRLVHTVIALGVIGCASAPAASPAPRPSPEALPSIAAGTTCDPEESAERTPSDREAIAAAWNAEPRMEEMRVVLRAPSAIVRDKLVAAMVACKVPVAQSGGGVLEAQYGEQLGLIGKFALTTQAAVVALTDSTTLVRLSGQEISKKGLAANPTVSTKPISNKNSGRSREAWIALRNVAKQLRADPALRADLSQSTTLGLVYAR